jgi:Tfp pilus assembly protein FimV
MFASVHRHRLESGSMDDLPHLVGHQRRQAQELRRRAVAAAVGRLGARPHATRVVLGEAKSATRATTCLSPRRADAGCVARGQSPRAPPDVVPA